MRGQEGDMGMREVYDRGQSGAGRAHDWGINEAHEKQNEGHNERMITKGQKSMTEEKEGWTNTEYDGRGRRE